MITDKQRLWLDHLSTSNKTIISPFNPKVKDDFLELKREIQETLGNDVSITLRGSSSLEISGKGELDIYIPVDPKEFEMIFKKLVIAYGEPKSHYQNERARFNIKTRNSKAEVFLINKDSEGWKQMNIFEKWLKNHPEDLKKYEELKLKLVGRNSKDYYTEKMIFFNSIIDKATKE